MFTNIFPNLSLVPFLKGVDKMDLFSIFKSAQMGNEEAILILYNKFLPKIKRCSMKLNYETAETDITIRFLEFIKDTNFDALISNCDGAVVNYTNRFFNNTFVDLLNSRSSHMLFVYLDDENSFIKDIPTYDDQSNLDIDCFPFLTELQKKIILYRYIYGYSSQEIAQKLKVSRQAIDRTKNRAIKIIKTVYDEYFV
jgi:RNA polymerase sigma factor (sigma-70 family)